MQKNKKHAKNKNPKSENLAKTADFHNMENVINEPYTEDPDEENSVFEQGTLKDVRECCEDNIK